MGCILICFDLTPDLEEGIGDVNFRKKTATVSLEVHFKKLTEMVNIVMYREFENTIETDQYRSVVIDFTLKSSEVMNTFELGKVLKTCKAL